MHSNQNIVSSKPLQKCSFILLCLLVLECYLSAVHDQVSWLAMGDHIVRMAMIVATCEYTYQFYKWILAIVSGLTRSKSLHWTHYKAFHNHICWNYVPICVVLSVSGRGISSDYNPIYSWNHEQEEDRYATW